MKTAAAVSSGSTYTAVGIYDYHTLDASDSLARLVAPERFIMMLPPSIRTLPPAPITVDVEDSLSAGQGQPSHERGYV